MRRPAFIARQAAKPSGLLGSIIAAIMVRESESDNRAAIEALAVRSGDHVLDVGCGAGRSLELLLPIVGSGRVHGIDPSALMVKRALRRIGATNSHDEPPVQVASVEALPFEDEAFDAVMSVHTLYFWHDLGVALREIARVLRPGGRLVLSFRTSTSKDSASFPASVYRFRDLREVTCELAAAGLSVQSGSDRHSSVGPDILVAQKPASAGVRSVTG